MKIDWDGRDWYAIEHLDQKSYDFFDRFFKSLLPLLPNDWNIAYRPWQDVSQPISLTNISSKTVLLLWGERATRKPPEWVKLAGITLKPFCPESWVSDRILPFPNEYFHNDRAPVSSDSPISKRSIDVFYSGNLNRRRIDLYRGLTNQFHLIPRISACYPINGKDPLPSKIWSTLIFKNIKRNYIKSPLIIGVNAKIEFTNGFSKGVPWEEYWKMMCDSKIAICPPGFMSTETIRHVECCKAGTIVISGALPNFDFYRNAPFIIIKDWLRIKESIIDILSLSPYDQDRLGQQHLEWFQKKLSPESLALWVLSSLQKNGRLG